MCEPLLTHRNEITMASKLGSVGGLGTKARRGGSSVGELAVCGPGGARCIGGVSSSQNRLEAVDSVCHSVPEVRGVIPPVITST